MKKKIICILFGAILMIPLLSMTAIANSPPSAPTIEGPPSGSAGTSYTYGLCSSDPDQDDITYCIDFGDGSGEVCVGPFPSGTCTQVPHAWSSQGSYIITATAKDSKGAESDPSTLSVSMPRYKLMKFSFILQILQNNPIIKLLIGLLN